MGMVITQSAGFLDRNGGIDSGLTHHVRHAEGNESGEQACEQTSDQEAACGHRGLSGRGSRAGDPVVHPLMDCGARQEELAPCSAERKYMATSSSIAAKISQGSTWVNENGGAATATGWCG